MQMDWISGSSSDAPRPRRACSSSTEHADQNRRSYNRHREKRLVATAAENARRKSDPVEAEKWRTWRRERKRKLRRAAGAKKRGLPHSPQMLERQMDALAIHNARQAWRYWFESLAPNWWIRTYYRALGKPWSNPRLSNAKRYVIRYRCDAPFRAKELVRVWRLNERRAAAINATDDGSLTASVVMGLFAAAKHCNYCGIRMRSVDKTMDHMTPLVLGGAHTLANVMIVCSRCNYTKQARRLTDWLCLLPKQH